LRNVPLGANVTLDAPTNAPVPASVPDGVNVRVLDPARAPAPLIVPDGANVMLLVPASATEPASVPDAVNVIDVLPVIAPDGSLKTSGGNPALTYAVFTPAVGDWPLFLATGSPADM
jgi:hypothetical protein